MKLKTDYLVMYFLAFITLVQLHSTHRVVFITAGYFAPTSVQSISVRVSHKLVVQVFLDSNVNTLCTPGFLDHIIVMFLHNGVNGPESETTYVSSVCQMAPLGRSCCL